MKSKNNMSLHIVGNDVTGYAQLGPFRFWYSVLDNGCVNIAGTTIESIDALEDWCKENIVGIIKECTLKHEKADNGNYVVYAMSEEKRVATVAHLVRNAMTGLIDIIVFDGHSSSKNNVGAAAAYAVSNVGMFKKSLSEGLQLVAVNSALHQHSSKV